METWQFFLNNWQHTFNLAGQHAWVVAIAVVIAMATGVPIGIWITFNQKAADMVLYIAGIIMTIPSIALFGMMIPLLSIFGYGIGTVPAVIALVLYSQLPIIRNTYAAIKSVDATIIDAGIGMGMTRLQVLKKVQLPIGIGAIAAYIGAGGLGHYIFMGINQTYEAMINTGAVAVAVLAVVVDYLFGLFESLLVSKGLRT